MQVPKPPSCGALWPCPKELNGSSLPCLLPSDRARWIKIAIHNHKCPSLAGSMCLPWCPSGTKLPFFLPNCPLQATGACTCKPGKSLIYNHLIISIIVKSDLLGDAYTKSDLLEPLVDIYALAVAELFTGHFAHSERCLFAQVKKAVISKSRRTKTKRILILTYFDISYFDISNIVIIFAQTIDAL